MTANHLDRVRTRIAPWRRDLIDHPLLNRLGSIDAIRIFMEFHVFAVWDFMSLLKALQRRLTCVEIPWTPPANPVACRLVNQIVLGEESDEDEAGVVSSHFELYLLAMAASGAETGPIDRLLAEVRRGLGISSAIEAAGLPGAVRGFLAETFDLIDGGNLAAIASAFTFGRENLLPDVFRRIVAELDADPTSGLGPFRYYLDRHIEVDSEDHGPIAERLVADLCGEDPDLWKAAEDAAIRSLRARIALWDAIEGRLGAYTRGPESRIVSVIGRTDVDGEDDRN